MYWDAAGRCLGEAYGGKLTFPAQLVRVYGDVWLQCIAYAEAGSETPLDVDFGVIDLERESDGKAGHIVFGSMGEDMRQQAAFEAYRLKPKGWVHRRVISVSVSLLIHRVRRAAAEYNKGKPPEEQINLDAPFMPAPGSDEFKKLMDSDYFKLRDQLFTDMKTIKSREATAAKLGDVARAMVL